jgi:hypothetical protein
VSSEGVEAGLAQWQALHDQWEAANTERLLALGTLADRASWTEDGLRNLFIGLVNIAGRVFANPQTDLVAAGQSADWLINNCESLAVQAANFGYIADDAVPPIKEALSATRAAFVVRNRLLHDPWLTAPGDDFHQVPSRYRTRDEPVVRTNEEILCACAQMFDAQRRFLP